MVARRNHRDGSRFWGCALFPECRGTRPRASQDDPSDEAETIPVERRTVRAAVLLCHPDRHPAERQELATTTTASLLGHLQAVAR